MREIKFRAWNSEKKYMTYLFNPVSHGDINIFDFYFLRGWRGEGLIPMQYTGLNDKNGKEIYEGDIVQGKVDYQGQNIEITAPVEWMTRAAMFMVHDIYRIEQTGFGLCAIGKIRVIGNIYENPELIPKK